LSDSAIALTTKSLPARGRCAVPRTASILGLWPRTSGRRTDSCPANYTWPRPRRLEPEASVRRCRRSAGGCAILAETSRGACDGGESLRPPISTQNRMPAVRPQCTICRRHEYYDIPEPRRVRRVARSVRTVRPATASAGICHTGSPPVEPTYSTRQAARLEHLERPPCREVPR